METKRTDLHSHILPGIDDGAKNIEESLSLLCEARKQNIGQIVFTPHYNADRTSVGNFIRSRNESLKLLTECEKFKELGLSYRVGSEVYYSVSLADCDLSDLCFSGTNYILIELPTQIKPHGLKYTLDNVINRGFIPIIAHIERYSYIMNNPSILYDLVERGCLAHINAEVLTKNDSRSALVLKLIKWGIVQLICSDCHSIKKRPPDLAIGYSVIEKKLGKKYARRLEENSSVVFDNGIVDLQDIKKPMNFLGTWI